MNTIKEYDKNNNLIHFRDSNGYEVWQEFDEQNNPIHFRSSDGFEEWREYDKHNNLIHFRSSDGYEEWYDTHGNEIAKPTNPAPETPTNTMDAVCEKMMELERLAKHTYGTHWGGYMVGYYSTAFRQLLSTLPQDTQATELKHIEHHITTYFTK